MAEARYLEMVSGTAEKRSEIMRRIRSKGTQPELIVRKLIYSMGFRYRLHFSKLPGKPDIVFLGRRKIIFVHGCFWHQHKDCIHGGIPKSNKEYWQAKLKKNTERDKFVQTKIRELGWDWLIVWECQLDDLALLSIKIRTFLDENIFQTSEKLI